MTTYYIGARPFVYGARHRQRFVRRGKIVAPTVFSGRGYSNVPVERFYFRERRRNYACDELPALYYNSNVDIALREIGGTIIMHELGDGQNDYMTNKVIVEAVRDDNFDTYAYDPTSEFRTPKLIFYPRAETWQPVTVTGQDIIQLNWNAYSTLPNHDIYATLRQRPQNDAAHESLALVAPMTLFRRGRLVWNAQAWSDVVKSFGIVLTINERRTYG